MAQQVWEEEEPLEEKCGPCQRGGGLLLLMLGAGLAYIGTDLVTGGMLTRTLFGAARIRAAPAGDNDTEEAPEAPGAEEAEVEPAGD